MPSDTVLRRLRLRHLEALTVLAEARTVHAAAAALNLSQPAVSKMLREIEQAFGSVLFERSRQGIAANDIGRVDIQSARIILGELSGAAGEIDTMRDGGAAVLRIGTYSATATVPAAIVDLASRIPGIVVKIREGRVQELLERLLDGELDCVFRMIAPETLRLDRIDQLEATVISDDRVCVLASPAHALAGTARLRWRDLSTERWVLPPHDAALRQYFMTAFFKDRLQPPEPTIETLSPFTLAELVRLDPTLVGGARLEHGRSEIARGGLKILPVFPDIALPPLSAFTRHHRLGKSDTLQAFIASLQGASLPAAPRRRRSNRKAMFASV